MTLGGIRCHWIISQTAHLEGVCMRELSSLANSHHQLATGFRTPVRVPKFHNHLSKSA